MTSLTELNYLKKLLKDDFLLPTVSKSNNLLENADPEVISEIDKLLGVRSSNLTTNKYLNKKTEKREKKYYNKYNIEDATITRHSHIR